MVGIEVGDDIDSRGRCAFGRWVVDRFGFWAFGRIFWVRDLGLDRVREASFSRRRILYGF